MLIEKLKTEQLIPAEYNPRKDLKPGDAEYEKLKRSIEQFGYVEPVIWNKSTSKVVGGHQRLKVLLDMGITEVECVVIEMDEDKEKALNVALNKISGDWDKDKLALLISDLQGVDFDISLTGFEPAELDELLETDTEAKEDNFDVDAELQKPCFSKNGDVWHLGKHTIICGDSTEIETYKNLLGDVAPNLVCTDPPYLVSLKNASGTIKNDDLNDKDGYDFLLKAFKCFHDVMAKDASIYVFYATMKARVFYDAYEDAGFKVGAGLIWKKPRAPFMRTDWKFNMEPLIFGWRKDGKHIWYGDQKQKAVFEFEGIKNSKEDGFGHPSSKPVPLIAYLITQCTQVNGIVLDGFLGSASTLIACEQLNRICYGIEFEPKFIDVAVNRYYQYISENKNSDEADSYIYVIRDGEKIKYSEVAKNV